MQIRGMLLETLVPVPRRSAPTVRTPAPPRFPTEFSGEPGVMSTTLSIADQPARSKWRSAS